MYFRVFCTKKRVRVFPILVKYPPAKLRGFSKIIRKNTGDRGSLFVVLTLSSISMPSALDQLNSDEVATEVR